LSAETVWKAEACASVSVRLGARNTSPTRKSSNLRGGTTVKPTGSKEPGLLRLSVCEFIRSTVWVFVMVFIIWNVDVLSLPQAFEDRHFTEHDAPLGRMHRSR